MRVAALYDIHGNLPALEVVLREIRRESVDQIVVGGDVVPGPMAREALSLLKSLEIPTHFIQGNGETAILEAMAGRDHPAVRPRSLPVIRWTAHHLQAEFGMWLTGWPMTVCLDVEVCGRVLFCHGTPRDNNEIFTRLTPEERLLPIFAGLDASLVVCGHTHMQFNRMIGKTRVVNAGSVGMPFGKPGADWLILGPTVELRHSDYDEANAAERLRSTEYPEAGEFVEQYILTRPSEVEMLQKFT